MMRMIKAPISGFHFGAQRGRLMFQCVGLGQLAGQYITGCPFIQIHWPPNSVSFLNILGHVLKAI